MRWLMPAFSSCPESVLPLTPPMGKSLLIRPVVAEPHSKPWTCRRRIEERYLAYRHWSDHHCTGAADVRDGMKRRTAGSIYANERRMGT